MIVPTITYNCILQGSLTAIQKHKLCSVVNRDKSINNDKNLGEVSLPSLENETKKQSCLFVKKCLDQTVCDEFKDYYKIIQHNYNTCNKGFLLKLPKMRTEYGKRSVLFNGAKIYNELPIEIRKIENFKLFMKK